MRSAPMNAARTAHTIFPTFVALACHLSSSRLWRWVATRVLVPILVLGGFGYLSVMVTAGSCVRSSRLTIEKSFALSGVVRPLRWVPPDQLFDIYQRHPIAPAQMVPPWPFRASLFRLHLYFPPGSTPLPWAYVRFAPSRYPFIACVHYGLGARDLYGEAGMHIYLAFFGLRVRIADWPAWYS